jgi:hypothetical protein
VDKIALHWVSKEFHGNQRLPIPQVEVKKIIKFKPTQNIGHYF